MTLPCTTQEDGGNTQWCQARGQEAMSRNWRTKGSTQTCPYCVGQINHRGKNFPLWRYPKAVWTHSWLMCHRAPCLSREVGLDGPFPPYWFCVIILGPKMFLPQEEGLAPSIYASIGTAHLGSNLNSNWEFHPWSTLKTDSMVIASPRANSWHTAAGHTCVHPTLGHRIPHVSLWIQLLFCNLCLKKLKDAHWLH